MVSKQLWVKELYCQYSHVSAGESERIKQSFWNGLELGVCQINVFYETDVLEKVCRDL